MKILFDHQAFEQNYGGVSKVFYEIILNLRQKLNIDISIRFSKNIYLKELMPNIKYPFGTIYFPFKRRLIKKANLDLSIKCLQNGNYDLFHATFDNPYFLTYVKTKYVITVHDLIPEHNPEEWPESWLRNRKNIFLNAAKIITVSESTRSDFIYFYPQISQENIVVVYHGYSPIINNKMKLNIKNVYNNKYILFVGGRKGYKNYNFFISTIAEFVLKNNLNVICTGVSFDKNEKILHEILGVKNNVFSVFVNEKELNYLYCNALMLVFPSRIEGFGLPILEAWANSCPILLSNIPCFQEIAGNSALFFDLDDSNSLINGIEILANNYYIRTNLIERGKIRLQKYSWDTSCEKLINLYESIEL